MYIDDEDEPEGLGSWMKDEDYRERVLHRIACPEIGYPQSEACYASIGEWEEANGKDWYEYLNF